MNYYASIEETSPVTQGIIVEMFKEKGIACILKNRFTVSSDDKVEKRLLETDDEFNTALREIIGIKEDDYINCCRISQ